MEILYLLVPISVVVVFLIAIAFWWSLRNGQFDDLEGPGYRILMDDDKAQGNAAIAAQQDPAAAPRAPARAAADEAGGSRDGVKGPAAGQ
jgi:cbb3-type cytochrome oxidase maturation protein